METTFWPSWLKLQLKLKHCACTGSGDHDDEFGDDDDIYEDNYFCPIMIVRPVYFMFKVCTKKLI